MIKDLGELSAIAILALVIIALLWFFKFAITTWADTQTANTKTQSESQEKLSSALDKLSNTISHQNIKFENIDNGVRRVEDKVDKLREDAVARRELNVKGQH